VIKQRGLLICTVCLGLATAMPTRTASATTAATTSVLTFVEMKKDEVGGVKGLYYASDVAISCDGKTVYAASMLDDAVVVFERDQATGELAYLEMHEDDLLGVDGLSQATSVVVSPDSKHVYLTSQGDHAVAAFARDQATGRLMFVGAIKDTDPGIDGLDTAQEAIVSPDGAHVYVAGYGDDAVALFERNANTGQLTYVEMVTNSASVSGLGGASSVAVSPDGKHVYVAGQKDNALTVFTRAVPTGTLTYLYTIWDGSFGVDGLNSVWSVAISADGAHVYTAGAGSDNAVSVFQRNQKTGALIFVEVHKDGVTGVDGLDGATSVTVSPDGDYVYATGYYDNALVVFERDRATGKLRYLEMQQDGAGPVDGLEGIHSVGVSPESDHVYTAAMGDSAVAVFQRWFFAYLPLVHRDY
jgi:6-phosphogluconolactonase (cycloisomerase 2 family)